MLITSNSFPQLIGSGRWRTAQRSLLPNELPTLSPPSPGWPENSPVWESTLDGYQVVWRCHRHLTPRYRNQGIEAIVVSDSAARRNRRMNGTLRKSRKQFWRDAAICQLCPIFADAWRLLRSCWAHLRANRGHDCKHPTNACSPAGGKKRADLPVQQDLGRAIGRATERACYCLMLLTD
jgi:hypothetical protein